MTRSISTPAVNDFLDPLSLLRNLFNSLSHRDNDASELRSEAEGLITVLTSLQQSLARQPLQQTIQLIIAALAEMAGDSAASNHQDRIQGCKVLLALYKHTFQIAEKRANM